jgi:hypothetical protein
VVQHLVDFVVSTVELEGSVDAVEVVEEVERVDVAEAELGVGHHVVEVGFDVGIDHFLQRETIHMRITDSVEMVHL